MSTFGRPPGQISSKPKPPERGSFPLDHDGECKPIIADYLRCLRKVKGTNENECRQLAKSYLQCRMDHNLMAKDEFKNLGFAEDRIETLRKNDELGSTGLETSSSGDK